MAIMRLSRVSSYRSGGIIYYAVTGLVALFLSSSFMSGVPNIAGVISLVGIYNLVVVQMIHAS